MKHPPQLVNGASQIPDVQENMLMSKLGQDVVERKLLEPRNLRAPSTAAIAPEEVKIGSLLSPSC